MRVRLLQRGALACREMTCCTLYALCLGPTPFRIWICAAAVPARHPAVALSACHQAPAPRSGLAARPRPPPLLPPAAAPQARSHATHAAPSPTTRHSLELAASAVPAPQVEAVLTGLALQRTAAAGGRVPQLQAAKPNGGLAVGYDMDGWGQDCSVQKGTALMRTGRRIALCGRWRQHSPTADRPRGPGRRETQKPRGDIGPLHRSACF